MIDSSIVEVDLGPFVLTARATLLRFRAYEDFSDGEKLTPQCSARIHASRCWRLRCLYKLLPILSAAYLCIRLFDSLPHVFVLVPTTLVITEDLSISISV